MANPKILRIPMTQKVTKSLRAGDMVSMNGILVTGRDRVHEFLFHKRPPLEELPVNLEGMVLYHCGPVVRKTRRGYHIIASGPTTSIRLEMYEHQIISEYGLRGIMGKGGMGEKTRKAMQESGCVYFQAIGGAAVYLAEKVNRVVDVWKLEEFGSTEAMWIIEVMDFPAVVTIDADGRSLHADIAEKAAKNFREIIFSS